MGIFEIITEKPISHDLSEQSPKKLHEAIPKSPLYQSKSKKLTNIGPFLEFCSHLSPKLCGPSPASHTLTQTWESPYHAIYRNSPRKNYMERFLRAHSINQNQKT